MLGGLPTCSSCLPQSAHLFSRRERGTAQRARIESESQASVSLLDTHCLRLRVFLVLFVLNLYFKRVEVTVNGILGLAWSGFKFCLQFFLSRGAFAKWDAGFYLLGFLRTLGSLLGIYLLVFTLQLKHHIHIQDSKSWVVVISVLSHTKKTKVPPTATGQY